MINYKRIINIICYIQQFSYGKMLLILFYFHIYFRITILEISTLKGLLTFFKIEIKLQFLE